MLYKYCSKQTYSVTLTITILAQKFTGFRFKSRMIHKFEHTGLSYTGVLIQKKFCKQS